MFRKTAFLLAGLLLVLAVSAQLGKEVTVQPLPGPGKKCRINDSYYFKYEFNQKPQMGMVILKIRVFDSQDRQVAPFSILGHSDMPSMQGAHDSGDQDFKLNRKSDYLLPVNVVMPGDWEVRITIRMDGKPIFSGSIRFDV